MKSMLLSLFAVMGGGYAIKKMGGAIFQAGATTQDYAVRLQHLLGSQAKGNELFKRLAEYASKVPFEYENIIVRRHAACGRDERRCYSDYEMAANDRRSCCLSQAFP